MKSDFLIALTQLAAERNLPREMVLSAIEVALASAYKKDHMANDQNIAVRLSPGSGDVHVHVLMTVVESVEDPRTELSVKDARAIRKESQLDDVIETQVIPYTPGRIAAQTAKQVVLQRLREAERDLVFAEYANRVGEVIAATIQRVEPRQTTVDLGRADGVLPDREQVITERYRPNQKLKVYIADVSRTGKGPEIVVSRAHRDLLRRLFELEVPEVYNGIVEIKAIAREAGSRSKVAVWARQEGVDAVGSCVGLRGIRIQNVVNELQGEKIDVVQWNRDPIVFMANALNPAQVSHVQIIEEEGTARVVVQDKQLSLAIGKEGQNARLAAKLTGWKIDILSASEAEEERLAKGPTSQLDTEEQTSETSESLLLDESKATSETITNGIGTSEGLVLPAHAVLANSDVTEDVSTAPDLEPSTPQVEIEQEATVTESAADMSMEEQEAWLQQAIEDETAAEASEAIDESSQDEEEAIPLTDEIWQVPQLVPSVGGQIRFAEDIAGSPRNSGGRGGGRRGRGNPGGADDDRGSKGSKKGRRQPVQQDRS
ncbi:MAG: transcription termination factor NusA [Chloroflexota bacterium]|nr:transcription termination factor NusA [Chloroflexota bacterium]